MDTVLLIKSLLYTSYIQKFKERSRGILHATPTQNLPALVFGIAWFFGVSCMGMLTSPVENLGTAYSCTKTILVYFFPH